MVSVRVMVPTGLCASLIRHVLSYKRLGNETFTTTSMGHDVDRILLSVRPNSLLILYYYRICDDAFQTLNAMHYTSKYA